MKSIKSSIQKTIASSLIFCLASPSYAVLGLLNVPPQSVTPPVPNVIVTLDDSGSMDENLGAIAYDPAITYVIPPNANGVTRANAGGQPRAYLDGYNNQSNNGDVDLTTSNRSIRDPSDPDNSGAWVPTRNVFNALPNVAPFTERQNFAVYFSYYRYRNLMMRGAVMRSFAPQVIPDGRFRLAWQTLGSGGGKCGGFSTNICNINNRLSSLEGGHRDTFFDWVRGVPANTGTPLRVAYTRVGEYLKTTGINGAFAHRPGVTELPTLSCRRSYHVLATDGGWNDSDSQVPFTDADNVAGTTLPDGVSYGATAPYKGRPGSSGQNTLADVAFKYWSTDLQPTLTDNVAPFIKKPGGELYGTTTLAPYWNPKNNPATWQNLTLYAIGFGDAGNLRSDGRAGFSAAEVPTFTTGTTDGPTFAEIVSGTRQWPTKNGIDEMRAFDLWHAAVNSRGTLFSAKRPDEIVSAFQSIVAEILASNAPTGGGSSSQGFTTDFLSVRSGYEGSPTWRGVLQGFGQVNSVIGNTPIFDAAAMMTAQAPTSRVILTADKPKSGIPFRSVNSLSNYQRSLLNQGISGVADTNGQIRLDYLRGSRANETVGTVIPSPELRSRDNSILGTIVNSEPRVIGQPRSGFVDSSYKAFRDANATRQKVIYVGANDGMLHGFNGNTGAAMLSYVPRGVFARLSAYTDPTYAHKYYVDGAIIPGDAFVDGAWKTMLFGGLGAGGKGFYGLDITNPSAFSESNAANIVKFDYTAPSEGLPPVVAAQFAAEQVFGGNLATETTSDLGHIMGDGSRDAQVARSLQVAKMQNGKWAYVTGNGVNSVSEKAGLYIVYLDTGEPHQKVFPTNIAAAGPDNGMQTPLLLDADGDGKVDTIYAGDLKGNLWKFVAGAGGAFAVGNNGAPIIKVGKPIVTAPVATVHPRGGIFISFGTGRLITVDDKTSTNTQTLYGVWDKIGVTGTVPLVQLVSRSLSGATASVDGPLVRTVAPSVAIDWSVNRGWFMDLSIAGERIVFNPILNGSNVFYQTLIPIEGTACSAGGQAGSLLSLNMVTGKAPLTPAFDVNNDGVFNSSDKAFGGANSVNTVAGLAAGIGKLVGVVKTGRGGGGKTCRLLGAAGDRVVGCVEGPGRLLWRDITP